MSTITMTNVDPGEGAPLGEDRYLAVYGESGLLDVFYPVGCFFETTDENFNPNVSWGGTWTEDTSGRVTVAYQSDSTPFNEIGKTVGSQTNDFSTVIHYGDSTYGLVNRTPLGYADRIIVDTGSRTGTEAPYTPASNLNNLQPYIVVKRWHRIA